ncbi:hypothetical protein ACHAXM_011592 [Skeletonema potamos]|jgi:hypothetical protein
MASAKHNGVSSSFAAGGSSVLSASATSVHANIQKRNTQMEQRKLELLMEARKARMEWILDDKSTATSDAETEWDGTTNPLKDLQACTKLPNAPDIIRGLLSSKCDWVDCSDRCIASKIALNVKDVMEKEKLQWSSISKIPENNYVAPTVEKDIKALKISETMHQDFNLTPIPPPATYDQFLKILCEPSAADIVISIQNFCKTVKEAARVMTSLQGETKIDGKGVAAGTTKSELKQKLSVQNHSLSLVKALRGFINSTIRDMEKHSAFDSFRSRSDNGAPMMNGNIDGNSDNEAKERLIECLEKFLYTKCRHDIDLVLSWEVEPRDDEHYHTLRGSIKKEQNSFTESDNKKIDKLVKDSEVEMHDKLKSLQFVTPRHLEIQCLASKHDIDLSYPMQQLQSLNEVSSPRQMLQAILLVFRGINVALNSAIGQQSTPPGADDILPTLILTVLRANPPSLLTNILFIERFAPVSLLRGEAGYAYTNLCGAVQFLRDLDVDEHMADVSMGEGAVLSIDPSEFRAGLEKCRMIMKAEEDKKAPRAMYEALTGTVLGNGNVREEESAPSFDMNIAASDVRHARSIGYTADLDWALKKQKELMWKDGNVRTNYNALEVVTNGTGNNVSFLPPEEPPLPSNFSRSYSYLASSANDIRMSDLPRLLKEYRMLVHATESLLNERQTWRESERKRLMQMEREKLERTYEDVIGKSSE